MTGLLEASGLALPGRLEPTDLALRAGELVCLVGPNGSGKTSLLHAIAGIGSPAGRVRIEGIDPRAAPPGPRARLLAYLPASRDVKWPLTARDLIALGGADPAEIGEAAAALDIAPIADRRVDRLSTGERSRVLIARALAPNPKLFLFDEPTANLDPLWQIRLIDLLKERLAGGGHAALMAIHDLDAAARCADRLIVMDKGRIAADGPPAALLGGAVVRDVFGVERVAGEWRPVTWGTGA